MAVDLRKEGLLLVYGVGDLGFEGLGIVGLRVDRVERVYRVCRVCLGTV